MRGNGPTAEKLASSEAAGEQGGKQRKGETSESWPQATLTNADRFCVVNISIPIVQGVWDLGE